MNTEIRRLGEAIIAKYTPRTLEDVLSFIPLHMCHVTQEPEVFNTYPPNIVHLSYPREQWPHLDAEYARYRDEVIPGISLAAYLRAFIDPDSQRLPCFCTEMSDVAGVLVSILLGQRVYAIRKIFVNYLYLPQRWHCINALVEGNRIRYFDSSAYRQVFDKPRRKFLSPDQFAGFDYADVAPDFIVSKNWLQSAPFARSIDLDGDRIRDNFYPNPTDTGGPDEFFRVYE
ncbi:hypothetical protein WL92_27155 [Burkholderia multivorans]|uniref:hypothetical protein n=1 Tax=Burkholderia multivorans TaxID=87883 RepID=UPI00075B1B21|nr:hypothetical protein [Burkholderia multivorans]KWF73740.1 hypothetical protein WL91_06945 [Burkholderia multivorans]KWF73804.1 hypothetical protein WL92_27155 [Burkholderia multivorans]